MLILLLALTIVSECKSIKIEKFSSGYSISILNMNHLFPSLEDETSTYKVYVDDIINEDVEFRLGEMSWDDDEGVSYMYIGDIEYVLYTRCTIKTNYVGVERYVRTCAIYSYDSEAILGISNSCVVMDSASEVTNIFTTLNIEI